MTKSKISKITCPFCLNEHDISQSLICPKTALEIPEEFSEYEPIWLVTVGFAQQGKSVYLTALMFALEELGAIIEDVTFNYLDAETKNVVRMMKYDGMEGALPPPIRSPIMTVPEKLERPLLMLKLGNLPGVGTRLAVVYDVAGEIFTRFDEIHQYIPALKHVRTVWFFVSLNDLYAETSVETMAELFNTYQKGMRRLGASLENRTMIVVYTKGDTRNFSPAIDDYLANDPLRDLTNRNADKLLTTDDFDWQNYTSDLKSISEELRVYTQTQLRGGRQFISSTKSENMRVEFCVVSALGANPDFITNKMGENATRFRVIDPFIWTILIESGMKPDIEEYLAADEKKAKVVSRVEDIFLSYSRHDALIMQRLRDNFRENGLKVWVDEEGLEPGTPAWEKTISAAIRNSRCIVVILSPDAEQSDWVGRELALAETPEKRIFPILARGTEKDPIPLRLRTHQWLDARDDYNNALLKLINVVRKHLNSH